jgi:hypothetical protein
MRVIVIILGAVLSVASLASAEPVKTERGLAGHADVEYGPALRAKVSQSPTSPVMVRVFEVGPAPERQRIEFIGAVAGTYDLRDFVEREDGRALGDDFPALPVVVVSRLPAEHTADLYGAHESVLGWRVHYRELLWTAAGAWLAIPIIALIVRTIRRPAPEPAPPPPIVPTLADEIRALLEAGRGRALSVDERGRLELMVLRFLTGDAPAHDADEVARVVRTLREDSQTRGLVRAVEGWLHARDAGPAAHERATDALEAFRRSRLSNDAVETSEVGA